MRRLSLRARLLLGVIALVAIGLTAADVTTYTSQRSFLLSRVDQTLETSHILVEGRVLGGPGGDRGGPGPRGPAPAGVDWYELRTLTGTVVRKGSLVAGISAPRPPAAIAVPAQPNARASSGGG